MKPAAGLLVLLVSLAAAVTYPQVGHIRTGVHDFGDPLLNAWTLAWTPHAIANGVPVFNANIFYPERSTLALSETLIFPALLVAPLRAAGANAILIHNITLLSGFVLSGLTMFLLVRSLTADASSAVVAAVAFAASPLRAEHYPRVQMQLTYLMPLALYFVHRIVQEDRTKRTVVLLGVSCGALFYSCVYYWVYFTTVLPGVVVLCFVGRRQFGWPGVSRLLVAGAIAAAALAPAVPAYLHNRDAGGERQAWEVERGSAEPRDYLRPNRNNLLYGDRNRVGPAERNLFSGYVLPATALTAVLSPVGGWLPYAAGLLASFDLSLGLNGLSYEWLYKHVLVYKALRVPARNAVLVNMFLAILAGLGWANITRRVQSDRVRALASCILVAALAAESLNRPLVLRDMPGGTPAVYEWLRDRPAEPIVEYPVGGLEGRIGPQDPTYMYYSTFHWRPMLNGYSGFAPPSYGQLLDRLREFPSAPSLAYLRERGVRYLLVHERFYLKDGFDADVDAIRRTNIVSEVAMFRDPELGRTYIYEFLP